MFTTLKALKWAHNLGVKQERTRIARELENAMTRHHNSAEISSTMLRDPKISNRSADRLKFRQAVHYEVLEIVNTVMAPQNYEQNPTSVMFPEGDK